MSLRGFQVLAIITAVFSVLAVWALLTDQKAVAPRIEPHPAFPDLEEQRAAIKNILVSGKDGVVRLRRRGPGPWQVESSDGYPADQAAVARLISAMETLTLIEARTKRPERFSLLKLDDPKAGNGAVGIQLLDREEALIAGLILGSTVAPPTPDRPGMFHVRLRGDPQAWLAKGRVISPPDTRSWLDQNMGLPADTEIRAIEISPSSGPSYAMDRETADVSFVFRSLPEGRRLRTPSAPTELAQSLAFLTIENAHTRPRELPEPASIATFETFDGRRLKLMQWTGDGQPWMAIDLEGDWGGPLRSRASAFIFRLSPLRAQTLSAPLESLLIPPG